MRRGGFRLALAIVLTGSLGSGCQLPKPRKPYPPDPMFECKQPLDKPANAPTTQGPTPPPLIASAVAAPTPPQFPPCFLASPSSTAPPDREDPRHPRLAVDHDPAPPRAPSPIRSSAHPVGASEETGAEESTQFPMVRGHADDFRWLAGMLEKQIDGRLMLRFGDASAPFGGKVCLLPVGLLTCFTDGDVIRVEGIPVPRLSAPPADLWDDPPVYRVIAASRVR